MDNNINEKSQTDTQQEIHKLAYTDYLTGLVNRRGLYNHYNNLNKNLSMHFMFIDIDNFKRVNDVYGHSMGDILLVKVSELICSKLPNGYVARIGGDEFVAIIDGSYDSNLLESTAQLIIDDLENIDFKKDILSLISLSIGIILDQPTELMLDDILCKCDSAMYKAKADGKSRYVVYHTIEKAFELEKTIESQMRDALENGEFHVYLQPKINMISSKLVGAEALSRWLSPEDGIRMPAVYIPLFEKNGFITELDLFVYEETCRIKASWKGLPYEHLTVSVNMSRLHFYHPNFPEQLKSIADKYEISTDELELEITESGFIKDSYEIIAMVSRLRDIGFNVSIDDFGSGYSALNMLKNLPVTIVKLDKDFIQFSTEDTRGQTVLKNIIYMCKDLKLKVVAEGVETKAQVDFITGCGCDTAQGFFYSKPLPLQDFNKYASEHFQTDSNCVCFSFNNNFESDCGRYKGSFVGKGYSFLPGPKSGMNAIHFPGGATSTNYVSIPQELLSSNSYTVALWVNPDNSLPWTSLFFAEYQTGFMSYIPLAWDGNCSYRIRDHRAANGWYDTPACRLWEHQWTHVAFAFNYITEKTFLYLNGILSAEVENVPPLYAIIRILLGGDLYQDSFQGRVADLRIYSDVKTPTEIKDLFLSVQTDPSFQINN